MKIKDIEEALESILPQDGAPVVVYCAIWPFLRTISDVPQKEIPKDFLSLLLKLTQPDRDLIMPTFGPGFNSSEQFNLDETPSSTGVLSELFRQTTGSQRSLSAFFSFNILGPSQLEFSKLQPEFAWGDQSTYHWMEKRNVHFVMLGTHPTNCSYLHRIEWLCQDLVNYRFNKSFSGTILSQNNQIPIQEQLFVRKHDPSVINDFTILYPHLKNGGMTTLDLNGVKISHMRCQDMKETFLPLFRNDPFITVANRDDFIIKETNS